MGRSSIRTEEPLFRRKMHFEEFRGLTVPYFLFRLRKKATFELIASPESVTLENNRFFAE